MQALRFSSFAVISGHGQEPSNLIALDNYGRLWTTRYSIPSQGPLNAAPWSQIPSEALPDGSPEAGPKFVSIVWVSTGNYVLGLKDDGTFWKTTSPTADPLVWTLVSS